MPLRGKAKTDGLSVFMSFHLADIRLCLRLGRRSLEDGRPPRRCPRDGCPRDGWRRGGFPRDGKRPRGRKTERDVHETEGVLLLLFFKLVEARHEWVLPSN